MVKISIIMPVYNSEKFLINSLNSVINQSFRDFELICIDDGSTDDSLNILEDYARKDSRIRIFSQKNNGSGAARNIGLKMSEGEYICFMDSDDFISGDLLQLTYNNIVFNDSDIVLFKISNIQDDMETFVTPDLPYEKIFPNADFNDFTFNYHDIKDFILKLYYAPWTKLYKKEFLNQFDDFLFDEDLPYEDILFHVKSMLRASKISFLPKYLYHYRIDNSDSVSFYSKDHIKIFDVIDNIESFLNKENYLNEFKMEFEYFKLSQIMIHMVRPVDADYFKLAKYYLNHVDLSCFTNPPMWLVKRCEIFNESTSAEEYGDKIKVPLMIEENIRLKRVNKKLKRERKRQKKLKKQLLSSNSWKSTEVLRKVFNKF